MLCSRGRQQFTRAVLILIRDMNETGVTVGGEGPKRKIFHFIWSFKSMHNFLSSGKSFSTVVSMKGVSVL